MFTPEVSAQARDACIYCSYEESTRLAETRLAQKKYLKTIIINYLNIAEIYCDSLDQQTVKGTIFQIPLFGSPFGGR